MENQIIYGSTSNRDELQNKLSLLAPSKFLNSNSILDFERFKKIEIDWLDLLNIDKKSEDAISSNFKTSIQLIQEYFFKYWDNKSSYHLFNVDSDSFKNEFNNLTGLSDNKIKNKYWKLAEIGYLSNNKQGVSYSSGNDVFCLIHHESERLYYFSNKRYEYFTKSDFEKIFGVSDLEDLGIQNFWDKLDKQDLKLNVNVCFEKSQDNTFNEKYFFSKNSSIDRSLIYLREEFFRLDNELTFLTKLKNTYDDIKKKDENGNDIPNSTKLDEIAVNFSNTLDQEQLNVAKQSYFDICNRYFEVKNRIQIIINRVADTGIYKLCQIDNEPVLKSDGKTPAAITDVKRGDIIQYVKKEYVFSETYIHHDSRCLIRNPFGGCILGEPTIELRTRQVKTILETPIRVDLIDPLQSFKIEAQKENSNIQFFTFVKTSEGYVSEENGVSLSQLLKQCEEDETFRLNCVIITYDYDFILTEKKYPVNAKIFFAPLPTMFSQDLPELSIRETLAYRIAWEGAELGQLVNSINLAPGESRQISLSTSFTQNTTKSSSLKTTSDLNTSNSFDLSTELQNEATKEISKTDSFSANVSGSYGGIVSGGASGSTTSSVKTFTRDMSKLARKTSSSINRRLVSEINESSSQSITVSQSSSRTSNISNINQGSTLNLMIYQINNRYKSGLFLDELQMSIVRKTELIPNSGLYEFNYYNFHNEDVYIENIINNINPLLVEELCCVEKCTVRKKIAQKINETIYKDYVKESEALKLDSIDSSHLKKGENADEIDNLFKEIRTIQKYRNKNSNQYDIEKYQTEKKKLDLSKEKINTDEIKATYDSETKEYCDNLKTKSLINKNLFEDEELKQESYFTINSGAFFIDSIIGMNPATEKYSEDMRNLEKDKVAGKNNEQKIKNLLLQKDLPYITKIANDTDKNRSIVHLSTKIKCNCVFSFFCTCSKHFKVYIDNRIINNCKIKLSKDKYYIVIDWNDYTPALKDLEQKLEILFKNSIIKYLD